MWVSGGQCTCWVAGSAAPLHTAPLPRSRSHHSQGISGSLLPALPGVTEDQQGTWLTWAAPPRGIPPHLASELMHLQQMGNEDSVRSGSNHSLNG